jgi:hypothetical protein
LKRWQQEEREKKMEKLKEECKEESVLGRRKKEKGTRPFLN